MMTSYHRKNTFPQTKTSSRTSIEGLVMKDFKLHYFFQVFKAASQTGTHNWIRSAFYVNNILALLVDADHNRYRLHGLQKTNETD